MPLRDHFHPPLSEARSWDALHGAWPAMIVSALNQTLPPRLVAEPRIRLGSSFEIDVAAPERDEPESFRSAAADDDGGVATAT